MHELAKKIGVKVEQLKKRGEVKIIFYDGELELRLSKKKALELLLWIFNKKTNKEG